MADRYIVTHQGRLVMKRGLSKQAAEREAEALSKRGLAQGTDYVDIKKDEGFVQQDNEIYRRYKRGGS